MDSVFIANEIVDKLAREEKKKHVMFKVDFAKTYDMVKWEYLDYLMGF